MPNSISPDATTLAGDGLKAVGATLNQSSPITSVTAKATDALPNSDISSVAGSIYPKYFKKKVSNFSLDEIVASFNFTTTR